MYDIQVSNYFVLGRSLNKTHYDMFSLDRADADTLLTSQDNKYHTRLSN